MGKLNTILKSFCAGMIIGIAAFMLRSMQVQSSELKQILGILLFAGALISIKMLDLNLFTGTIGYIKLKPSSFGFNTSVLFFNILGTALIALLTSFSSVDLISNFQTKMQLCIDNKIWFLGASLLCGAIMYFAVETYRRTKNPTGIAFLIPIFIFSGFEHSIVNIYYCLAYFFANNFVVSDYGTPLILVGLCLSGNIVGAILARVCTGNFEEEL